MCHWLSFVISISIHVYVYFYLHDSKLFCVCGIKIIYFADQITFCISLSCLYIAIWEIYCSCTPQTQNNTRLKSLWKRDLKTQISFFPVYITQIPISLCKFSLTFMWFKYFHENLITTRMIEPMVNKYTFRLFRINNAVILYRISANSPLLSSPR